MDWKLFSDFVRALRTQLKYVLGNFGVGIDTPIAKLHIANDDGTVPTLQTGTIAVFNESNLTTDVARIAIVGGNTGWSGIDLGDTDDIDVANILYNHTDGYFRFKLDTQSAFFLLGGGGGCAIQTKERTSDPANPTEGHWAIWMSDGTGSGDDGDIMVKITAGGSTKTTTLIDFSTI